MQGLTEWSILRGNGRARRGGWRRARWGVLVAALSACAQPEPLALEHEVYEVYEGGVESLVNAGCNELPEGLGAGFGFGFGTAPGARPVAYSVSYLFETDRVLVSAGPAGSAGQIDLLHPDRVPVRGGAADVGGVAVREYDATFLTSGDVDDLTVELGEGFALRLVNRGAPGCPSAGESPPLSGDIPAFSPGVPAEP